MSRVNRQKEKERRARKLLKDQQAAQELAEREIEAVEEETPPEEVETVEKDLGETLMDLPQYLGPTSFDELDAQKAAQDQAQEMQEVIWDTQDLVRNILNDPRTDSEQKSQKMQAVAADFEERVSAAVADGEDLQKDMEQLELEALLAEVQRNAPPLQHITDLLKETVSYGSRKGMPDSNFALVYTDAKGKKVRKYLIHDASHVRNALARAAQQMNGPGAADAKKAMPKIKAAAKKFGIDMSMSKGLHIEKDAKGDWRWIGQPSNNFLDWQGDILSKAAHQKYCAWLDANPELAPQFMTWHIPGTARTHPVDFWMEHNGALIMSGKLTESEAAHLLKMQKQMNLGMSLAGPALRLNPADPREITDYWLVEVSDLPLDKAANPFTSLETITKEAGMDKLQYLTEMMGSEERAKQFLKKTGQLQDDLQAAGLTSKAQAPATPAPEPPPAAPAAEPAASPSMDAIVARIRKEFDLDGLNELLAELKEKQDKVEMLEAVVKDLQVSEDEKLAAKLTPPAMRFVWARQNLASQSDNTKLKKDADGTDEQLAKALPSAHWLSEVTHTAPVAET